MNEKEFRDFIEELRKEAADLCPEMVHTFDALLYMIDGNLSEKIHEAEEELKSKLLNQFAEEHKN